MKLALECPYSAKAARARRQDRPNLPRCATNHSQEVTVSCITLSYLAWFRVAKARNGKETSVSMPFCAKTASALRRDGAAGLAAQQIAHKKRLKLPKFVAFAIERAVKAIKGDETSVRMPYSAKSETRRARCCRQNETQRIAPKQ
jgi:hypothetical protein